MYVMQADEAVNNQVECEEILHAVEHMFLCHELIEQVPNAA